MNAFELRNDFLEFFKSHGHEVIAGAALIPRNDPSCLFTTAGMHPLVPYLLGEPHPQGRRLADVQKCLRTDDIEEVGDDIHLTFFEMLGNWSLGDYFKEEAIGMSYDFLVHWLHLDPDRLSVSVFGGDEWAPKDEESACIWRRMGITEDRIHYFDRKHNWWGPVGQTGPCGPDTEIFYDSLRPKCSPECDPSCGCGKYWEIWNNVFMEYHREPDGRYTLLPSANVDTGLGFERVAAILEGRDSIYETELFHPIVDKLRSAEKEHFIDSERIIADHIRASCFIIADGVTPGNVDQGYVLRRLIRRMIRHMRRLGVDMGIIGSLAETVIELYKDPYGELQGKSEKIVETLSLETARFLDTLEKGEQQLYKAIGKAKDDGSGILDGKTVFRLYDTFGFPPEMTRELAEEQSCSVDMAGYGALYGEHQALSRSNSSQRFKGGLADNSREATALHTATHLLHRALKTVLGEHAKQKGSNITGERLRFDFSHHTKLTNDELAAVEAIVNDAIGRNLAVTCLELPLGEARAIGAEGLFEDRYGDKVRVYSIGDFSMEICGGPHVANTSELGHFKILKEESAGSGIRRIKGVLIK